MTIGVLDIMGSVEEHTNALQKCKVKVKMVKSSADLKNIDGLIIPGGESTTIGKLSSAFVGGLRNFKKPIWGTCAGAILLAKRIANQPPRGGLKFMDITIARNGYGRQVDSFEADLKIKTIGNKPFHGIFIRAPKITNIGKKAEILALYGGSPVMVREGRLLLTTFHPELTSDLRVHRYFISLIRTI